MKSYLQEQTNMIVCVVPQGSIIGPLLCNIYIIQNNINYDNYADDTQIYFALSQSDCNPIDSLCKVIEQVNDWICLNFLQLNADKIMMQLLQKKAGS